MLKRVFLVSLIAIGLASQAFGYSGAGGIWVQPKGQYVPHNVTGDSTGFGRARDECIRAGGGVIQMGPGLENVVTTYPTNAGILVLKSFTTGWSAEPSLGTSQGGGYVIAYADSGFLQASFSGNGSGIQAAINYVSNRGGGKVVLGPGVFPESTAIGMRSNVWLQGSGMGITTIKRVYYDAAGTVDLGHMIVSTKPGASVVPNKGTTGGTPLDSLINITVSDLTLDGNYTAWPTVNPNLHGNFGIQFWFVDNALVQRVEIKNTLQTGIEYDACRNSRISALYTYKTGQEEMLGTRNGINLNNNSGNLTASSRWGRKLWVEDCYVLEQKDAGLDCANVSEVTIKHMYFYCSHDSTYGNIVYEFEGSLAGYTMQDFLIDGTTAIGLNNQFWTDNITAANLKNLTILNSYFYQGSSTVDPTRGRWAFQMKNSNNKTVTGVRVENGIFENMNAGGGTSTSGLVNTYGNAAYPGSDWIFKNLTWKSVNQAASNPGNRGVNLDGSLYDITFEDVRLEGVEDIGFWIHGSSSQSLTRNIKLIRCYVKGAEQAAFRVGGSGTDSKIHGVKILESTAEDSNAEGANYSYYVAGITNGEIVRSVELKGNKIIRNSGTNMQGLQIHQSGTGVCDSIWALDNDFSGASGTPLTLTNTPTNYFYRDPNTGHQMPNNSTLSWYKASSTTLLPIMRLDSTNVLRIYPGSPSGTIDFFGSDGTLRVRFPTAGGINITNSNAFLQMGGFTYLQDSSNDRRIFMKNDATGTIAIRDQANTTNLWTWNADGSVTHKAFTFATLPGTPVNGMMVYCSDCTIANPTASGGTGAFVKRLNGVWVGN